MINVAVKQKKNKIRKGEEGLNTGEIVERMIPIWGTYKEAEDFFENPSWGQAGWLLASAASDLASILPIVGPAAKAATTSAIASARAANTIGKAAKVKELVK